MKLLTANTGWAATRKKVFWTTDGGAQWKDITPKAKAERIASIFFLDEANGWVLLTYPGKEDPASSISEARFELASTNDSGVSWSVQLLDVPDPDLSRGLSGEAWLDFVDSQHGWLMVRMNGSTAVSVGVLRATDDGGKTWKSQSAPVAGPIRFLTAKDGWLTGGPTEDEIRALFVTHDGGEKWQEQRLRPPSQTQAAIYPTYDLPAFEDGRHGFLPVTFSGPDGASSALVLFATEDAGITWTPDRALLGLSEASQGVVFPSAVASSVWLNASISGTSITTGATERGKALTVGPTKTTTTKEAGLSKFSSILQLSFADDADGWLLLLDGELFSTSAGGATWRRVTPPPADNTPHHSNPITAPVKIQPTTETPPSPARDLSSSNVSAHVGFDRFPVIPSADMLNWMNLSPYYDVGIYLPGSKNKSNDPKLIPAWIMSVQGQLQGWGIMPIWFGLQSSCACRLTNPCVPYTYQFSTNTTQAKTDGINEAKAAIMSAQNLGLNPTIIYHDVENYTPDGSTCSLPVQAFLSGWDQQMHTVGLAGVYGNPAPASKDFSKASPIPDDVWIAKYTATGQAPLLTIWALGALSDSPNWITNQRIHQGQQNLSQAWGSAANYQIDPDIENATIIAGNGSKDFSTVSPSSFDYPGSCGTYAYGINDIWGGDFINGSNQTGEIVGEYLECGGDAHAFLLDSNLQYSNVDYPGAMVSQAFGINNLGQIVGTWEDTNYCDHGYLLSGGTYTSIDNPNTTCANGGTALYGINDAGQMVGSYSNPGGQSFVYYASKFYPNNPYTSSCCNLVNGINGDATVAGFYSNNGVETGFTEPGVPSTWTGSPSSFFDAEGVWTFGESINNNGDVGGYYEVSYLDDYALLYTNGVQLISFQYMPNSNTSYDTYGYGVNDFGQIVGYYSLPSGGGTHGYVATLQP
ncbi:MAG: glycoside hydrolase domain-containing protein [Candidatus Sulfotelmatobacter sp.]